MEELVRHLANLETGWRDALQASDVATAEIDVELDKLHKKIDELMEERETIQTPYVLQTNEFMRRIESVREQIINAWDGDKKTMVLNAGTLKFRKTGSLKIHDSAAMLEDLCIRMQSYPKVVEYLKGFNLTAVKKYMGVHDMPINVAEIEYKTTVKLE